MFDKERFFKDNITAITEGFNDAEVANKAINSLSNIEADAEYKFIEQAVKILESYKPDRQIKLHTVSYIINDIDVYADAFIKE